MPLIWPNAKDPRIAKVVPSDEFTLWRSCFALDCLWFLPTGLLPPHAGKRPGSWLPTYIPYNFTNKTRRLEGQAHPDSLTS